MPSGKAMTGRYVSQCGAVPGAKSVLLTHEVCCDLYRASILFDLPLVLEQVGVTAGNCPIVSATCETQYDGRLPGLNIWLVGPHLVSSPAMQAQNSTAVTTVTAHHAFMKGFDVPKRRR